MFQTDINKYMNDLNFLLQGKEQMVLELFENRKGFLLKLHVF